MILKLKVDKYSLRQALVGFAVTIDTFLLGAGFSFSATLLPQLDHAASSVTITDSERTWIASLSSFACIPGTLIGSVVVELLGRKWTYTSVAFLNAISWSVIAFSAQSWHLLLGRVIQGFVAGLGYSVCYCFIVEVISLQHRGTLLNMVNIGTSSGQLFVNVMGTYYSWRVSAYILSGISLGDFLVFLYLRNTHVWYLQRQRLEDAKEAYLWYRSEDDSSRREFEEQVNQIAETAIKFKNIRKEWTTREFLMPLGILMWFYGTVMCTGGYGMSLYSVEIMRSVVSIDEYLTTILIDVLRVLSSFIVILLLVYSPMRNMVIGGSVGITVSFAVLIGALIFEKSWRGFSAIILIAILVFNFIFNLCYVNIIAIIIGELFTGVTKPSGTALIATYFNLLYFASGQLVPLMFENLGNVYTFMVFCICNVIGGAGLYFILPETRNISSEKIRRNFQKKSESKRKTIPSIAITYSH